MEFPPCYKSFLSAPDGSTYEQDYKDFEDLLLLKQMLGNDYWIVDIY